MPLQLEIVSEHRDLVGDDAVRIFREEGGTIGRSLQNDWILPDPDRYISGRHATITWNEDRGCFFLEDLDSTNGTELDGVTIRRRERLGRLHTINFGGASRFIFMVLPGREAEEPAAENAPSGTLVVEEQTNAAS